MFLILLCLFTSFNVERLTFNSESDWIPTIAVDESCNVHIAYTYADQIRYITNKSGSWVINSIMINGNAPSIAVTPAGTPHITFEADCGGDDDIYYATLVGGVWDIDTVINNTVISSDPSIALSPDSVPHIVYYDFSGGLSIRHAYKSAGSWISEVIPGSSIGTYSSISIDASGNLHVAFVTGTYGGNREISYANDTSGSWVDESITNDAFDDDFPTIAVDKNGYVHIVYAKDDGADWELWYATNVSGSFVTTQLTNNVGINDYGYPSVAVDNNCSVHIAYQENNTAGDLFYLTNKSGSWERDTIFIGPLNKTLGWVDRSIAIDNLGYIHVSFANQVGGAFTQEIYHAVSDAPVGIETPRFFTSIDNYCINLHWSVEMENDCLFYIITRRCLREGGDYFEIARICCSGSSPSHKTYSYRDEDVQQGEQYYYKLGVVRTDGQTSWYGPITAVVKGMEGYFFVSPNPVIKTAKIKYGISKKSYSTLIIYDILGRELRKLYADEQLPGDYSLEWDGRDNEGKPLPTGIYFLRLNIGHFTHIEKIQIVN